LSLQRPEHGPDAMLSPDLPVSRGQWETIATKALALLGVQQPASRLDATLVSTRLELARAADTETPVVPVLEEF
jgi:hypothetical protein